MSIDEQYQQLKPFYEELASNAVLIVSDIVKKQNSIDYHTIFPRIKEIASVKRKMERLNERFSNIHELQDIAGIRIICHCISDVERIDALFSNELSKHFKSVRRTNVSTGEGYKALHYIVTSEVNVDDGDVRDLHCEIQIRTVLQDAWAIQSHKYGYKNNVEGDANVLKQTVSGILGSCENLWELVRKNVSADDDKPATVDEKIPELQKSVTKQLTIAFEADSLQNIGLMIRRNELVDIEELLLNEFRAIKKEYEDIHASSPDPESIVSIFDDLEQLMKGILVVGLLSVKYSNLDALKKIWQILGKISSISDRKDGLVTLLSIPPALIHNTFYYLGVFSLSKLNINCLNLLLNNKIEQEYNGRLLFYRPWESGQVMAPRVVHSATEMFNRLLKSFNEDDLIKQVLGIEHEEFLEIVCQFNFIFCMKAQVEVEKGMGEPWSYPNFGRFHDYRITPLLQRIKNIEEYKKIITDVLEETYEQFKANFTKRMERMYSAGLGSGYIWDSVMGWDDGF